jgi:hypothetical protein
MDDHNIDNTPLVNIRTPLVNTRTLSVNIREALAYLFKTPYNNIT